MSRRPPRSRFAPHQLAHDGVDVDFDPVHVAGLESFPASDPASISPKGGEHEVDASPTEPCDGDEIRADRAPFYVHDADRLRDQRAAALIRRQTQVRWAGAVAAGLALLGAGVLIGRARRSPPRWAFWA